jgi:serine protease
MGFKCSLFIAKIPDGGPCSNVAAAVTAAANRSSDVISMSIGGCDNSIASALNYAFSRGAVLVAAGDNRPTPDASTNYPAQWVQPDGTGPSAGFNRGLVVTAAKYDGTRATWAQRTSGVSVAAFGAASDAVSGGQQGILSTFPSNTTDFDTGGGLLGGEPPCGCRTTVNGSSNFAYLVGTSMATPQVSGVAALIRAVKRGMAPDKVSHLIKATASNCGTYVNGMGWGLIRADQAVAAAIDKDITPPVSNVRSAKPAHARGASVAARGRKVVNIRIKRHDPAGQSCAGKLPVSGVRKVIVFASANGGRYHRIAKTKKTKVHFRARRGRHYTFFSIAVDRAGNREGAPAQADAKTRVHR